MEKVEADSRLILEVESHPVLYNRSLPDYKLNDRKEAAWKEISSVLQRTSNIMDSHKIICDFLIM